MKKVVILLALAGLVAAPALATVVGSKHDLTTLAGYTGTNTEVCVFCHTPHGASPATDAPLWNRSLTTFSFVAAELYNSATLTAATKPTAVEAEVNLSDARLCLSCHDGVQVGGGLLNPPNSGTVVFAAGPLVAADSDLDILDAASLTNDHPIGMDYAAAQGADAELVVLATTGLTFYGDNQVMWCSTCHDVHDPTNAPFLVATNAASALCTTCHIK